MAKLEDFLAGKPLNDDMAKLMRGEEGESEPEAAINKRQNYADGVPITNQDREHLRRLLVSPGWQVLLKLLDTELKHQEDTARRISLLSTTSKDEILAAWAGLGADQKARENIEMLAKSEIEQLKSSKAKKKCAPGKIKTAAETN